MTPEERARALWDSPDGCRPDCSRNRRDGSICLDCSVVALASVIRAAESDARAQAFEEVANALAEGAKSMPSPETRLNVATWAEIIRSWGAANPGDKPAAAPKREEGGK